MERARQRDDPHPGRDLVFLVVVPAVVIAGIYVLPFVVHRDLLPFGSDTLGYIWRTDVARTLGLNALRAGVFPSPIQPLGNRPAYPIVAGVLDTIASVRPFTFAWISPALLAVVAGLAAGVVAVDGLEEPRRRAPLYAIGLGGSAFLAWTALGYATNLMLDGAALAIAAVILLMIRRRASWPTGAVLLAASALIHWMFASVFASILVAYTGATMIARARLRRAPRTRDDERTAQIPPPRALALLLLVGIPVGALALLTLPPQVGFSLPDVSAAAPSHALSQKLVVRDTAALVWFGGPLASLALITAFRTRRRWLALLLGIWASLALVGGMAWWVLRLPAPPYRWTAFALGLPVLAIAAGPWAGEVLVPRFGRVAQHLGGAMAVLICLALVVGGAHFWWAQRSHTSVKQRQELDTVSRYVEELPPTTPVFILVAREGILPVDVVFSGLPADRLPDVRLLPAPRGWDTPGSRLKAPTPGGVILAPSSFLETSAPEGRLIGPGVSLLLGPSPPTPLPSPVVPQAPSAPRFAWDIAVALLALCLAGSGWAQLLRVPVASRVALAPALGMTMMGLFGTALARAGVHPAGPGALAILALTAVVGFLAAGEARRRGTRRWVGQP